MRSLLLVATRAVSILFVGSGLAFAAASCGSSSDGETFSGPGAACHTILAGKCGNACSSDGDCGDGLYCSLGGTCSADCGEGQPCPSGSTCDGARGICNADGSALDGDVPDAPFSDACPNITVTFEKTVPTVLLLVDQSGSMTEKFGSDTRWNAARKALIDPTTGVVKLLEKEVRFGLALFTSKNGFSGGTCPMLTTVPIALGNYSAIASVYGKSDPIGDTPTGESIDAVVKTLSDPSIPGPKYIVLATDGEPDTCAVPNPQNGQKEAVAAAQNAYAKGIKTFYISVGSEVSAGHAQDMANAGQGLAIGGTDKAKYWSAMDPASIKDAFDTIIYGVRSCTFKLNAKVTDPTKGEVTLDGSKLTYGDANGWKLDADGVTVTLLGTSCDKIKSGDHSISAEFACTAVIK